MTPSKRSARASDTRKPLDASRPHSVVKTQRPDGREPAGRAEKAAQLVRRVDVGRGTHAPVTEHEDRRYLVTGVVSPRGGREAGDRTEPALPLPERPRRRRRFGRRLRPDVGGCRDRWPIARRCAAGSPPPGTGSRPLDGAPGRRRCSVSTPGEIAPQYQTTVISSDDVAATAAFKGLHEQGAPACSS